MSTLANLPNCEVGWGDEASVAIKLVASRPTNIATLPLPALAPPANIAVTTCTNEPNVDFANVPVARRRVQLKEQGLGTSFRRGK